MNITDVYEDSPNNYRIIVDAPQNDTEEAVRYYLSKFEVFERGAYPAEYATICYGMGRLLFADKTHVNVYDVEGRAKRIENALYYFNQAMEFYTYKTYPVMFALINVFMAKLFRERSMLFSKRSFLSNRGSPEESLEFGLDQAMEALPVFSLSKVLLVEHAICCVEIGYIYVLMSEYPQNSHDTSLREQAITYLERALTLSSNLPVQLLHFATRGKSYKWNVQQLDTYPSHIRLFLDNFSLEFLEGCAYYLLGRVEQGWGLVTYGDDVVLDPTTDTTTSTEKAQPVAIVNNQHIFSAFDHFSTCLRPHFLPMHCHQWSDAHHRIALLVVKYPELVDPDFFSHAASKRALTFSETYLFLDSAVTHFLHALRCKVISKAERMDLHFHCAQTHIMKLQRIIDQVPYGQSVTKTIVENDGMETMASIEEHLKEALSRVTAANNQSVQDAYLYFYSSLKLAEFRMLQAACAPSSMQFNREENLYDALGYLIDACIARPLPDNIDLHYIVTGQLAQILVAVKRTHAASKAYAKLLFCMSVLINRSFYNYTRINFERKLKADASRHASTAIQMTIRDTVWIKLHLGPMLLHEKVAPGFATWSFEDLPSARHQKVEDHLVKFSNSSPVNGHRKTRQSGTSSTVDEDSRLSDGIAAHDPYRMIKAAPPKGVPPLMLPTLATKKVFVSGDTIPDNVHAQIGDKTSKKPTTDDFKPPPGPVPLSALGHSIPLDLLEENQQFNTSAMSLGTNGEENDTDADDDDAQGALATPYVQRIRPKIPPIKEMHEIDKANRVAFSMGRGKVAYLMPQGKRNTNGKHEMSASAVRKQEEFRSRLNAGRASTANEGSTEEKDTGEGEEEDEDGEEDEEEDDEEYDEDEDEDDDGEEEDNGEDEDDFDVNIKPPSVKNSNKKASGNAGSSKKPTPTSPSTVTSEQKADDNDSVAPSLSPMNEEFVGRPRSQRIVRFDPNAPIENEVETQYPKKEKKKALLSWVFGGKKQSGQDYAVENDQSVGRTNSDGTSPKKKASSGWSGLLRNPFGRGGSKKGKNSYLMRPKKVKMVAGIHGVRPEAGSDGNMVSLAQQRSLDQRKLFDSIGLWATKPCYNALMIHSRHDRMQIVALGKQLQVLDGMRTCHVMYHVKQKYLNIFHQFRSRLMEDCAKIIAPPLSLKELSQLSLTDLTTLFRSHAKLAARLDDLEHFLFFKMTKVDFFVPYIASIPVFSRDIGGLDDALLDVNKLMHNVAYEKSLQLLQEKQGGKGGGGGSSSNGSVVSGMSMSHHTAIKQSTASSAGSSILEVGSTLTMNANEKAQLAEEKEDIMAGKMTFALSQSLDGSGFLREGQQGMKDMLLQHLAYDECILLWQVPTVVTQKVSVVLMWRDNSLSKHRHFSSRAAFTARKHDAEALKKQGQRAFEKMKRQQEAEHRRNEATHKGIVLEFAQSDLQASHLLQFLQRYLDALHVQPASMRMTLTSDALTSLSCALSLSELLLMIPRHVRSLVICCPPVLRLLPWHLLLIETSQHQQILGRVDNKVVGKNPVPSTSTPGAAANGKPSGTSSTSDQGRIIIHLCERYCVRLGPSLAHFELCATAASKLRHSVGMHRLCAIDGDDRILARSHPSMANTSGIRGADLETICAASLWSADPDDARILRDFGATKVQLTTTVFGDIATVRSQYERFGKFTEEIRLNNLASKALKVAEEDGKGGDSKEDDVSLQQRVMKPLLKKMMKAVPTGQRFVHKARNTRTHGPGFEEGDEDDDDEEDEALDEDAYDRKQRAFLEEERREHLEDVLYLTINRVLHVAARKALYFDEMEDENDESGNNNEDDEDLYKPHNMSALHIVQDHSDLHATAQLAEQRHRQRQAMGSANKHQKTKGGQQMKEEVVSPQVPDDGFFSAKDVVAQWYLKNNALTILSRYGYTDDLSDLDKHHARIEYTAQFIEAMHMAGACCVLYPMWDTTSTPAGVTGHSPAESGLLTMARTLFLLRFYATLPARSRDRLSIVECVRRVQTWLRNVTANDCIAFVAKTPLPALAKQTIISEMEALCAASVLQQPDNGLKKTPNKSSTKQSPQDTPPTQHAIQRDDDGNRAGGSRQFFTHFLLWGAFVVSGSGGNVHHPDLTLPDEDEYGEMDKDDKTTNRKEFRLWRSRVKDVDAEDDVIRSTKAEIQRLLLEAQVLRMEGRVEEAKLLEQRVRELRKLLRDRRIAALRHLGWKAGRGLMDTLDFLDKALLDQEDFSDEDEGGYEEFLSDDDDDDDKDDDGPMHDGDHATPHKSVTNNDAARDNTAEGENGEAMMTASEKELTKEQRRQKVFNPLTDQQKKDPKDIAYEAWRSKIGALNMEVKAPVLPPARGGATVATGRSQKTNKTRGKGGLKVGEDGFDDEHGSVVQGRLGDENYEFNKLQQAKQQGKKGSVEESLSRNSDDDDDEVDIDNEELSGSDDEEDEEDDEEGDEDDDEDDEDMLARYKKKKRAKKAPSIWSNVRKGVRSYGEIVTMLSEQPQKIAAQQQAQLKLQMQKQRAKLAEQMQGRKKKPLTAEEKQALEEKEERKRQKKLRLQKQEQEKVEGVYTRHEFDEKEDDDDDDDDDHEDGKPPANCVIS